MESKTLSIGELADAAGVSRRAIRFYVQRGLLPPPQGKGRGSLYQTQHLERLRRIQELQAGGHALDAIARLLEQGTPDKPRVRPTRAGVGAVNGRVTAQLWTRVQLGDGVELHVDTSRHALSAEQILAVRDTIRNIIKGE